MAIYQLGFTSAPLSTINLADTDSYIYKTTAVASPDTLIAQENGICNTIYVYKRSDKAAAGVVGVYDSSGNLLSSASFSNDNGLTGFFAITIPQFLITAGQKYEPVIVYTGATQYALYDSTAGNECSRLAGVSALPNPWTEPQNRTYLGGVYLEYESSGSTTHTVTYDGNSNTGGAVPVDGSSPYADGASVTVLGNTESLSRTGYVFVCWNTAADGTGANFESGDSFYLSADTTLYALWKTEAELIDAYLNPPSSGGMILMPRIYGG